jgi:hypothetical protein
MKTVHPPKPDDGVQKRNRPELVNVQPKPTSKPTEMDVRKTIF